MAEGFEKALTSIFSLKFKAGWQVRKQINMLSNHHRMHIKASTGISVRLTNIVLQSFVTGPLHYANRNFQTDFFPLNPLFRRSLSQEHKQIKTQ